MAEQREKRLHVDAYLSGEFGRLLFFDLFELEQTESTRLSKPKALHNSQNATVTFSRNGWLLA